MTLKPDHAGSVDHDLADLAINQQRLDGTEAGQTSRDLPMERLPFTRAQQWRMARDGGEDLRGAAALVQEVAVNGCGKINRQCFSHQATRSSGSTNVAYGAPAGPSPPHARPPGPRARQRLCVR